MYDTPEAGPPVPLAASLEDHGAQPAPSVQRTVRVQFTGSGSEYLRIWIVNALLTLSLYDPFAKARRLRFTGRAAGAYRALLPALLPLLAAALLPWLSARAKRDQHGHYAWANQTTALTARAGQFYRVWCHVLVIALLPFLGLMILVVIKLPMVGSPQGPSTLMALAALGLLTYVAVMLAGRAFLVARLRLEAVRVVVQGDPARWQAAATAGATRDATGDAAGDLLGIDIGL